MNDEALKRKALRLCYAVNKCDDRLGMYSDYEGNEEGPTYHLWAAGYEKCAAQCKRAIRDHRAAIRAWEKLQQFNESRKPNKANGYEVEA